MPYEIRRMDGKWCVVKSGTAERMGCHPSEAGAKRQMAALYAAEGHRPMGAMKASPIDDDAFRLLAFPFGGPIPHPLFPRGVDIDGETFTERTDIKADWLPFRLVDWHHGQDAVMGRTVLGKAGDLGRMDGPSREPDEDGWWVTVWMAHGERRTSLVRALADRGAQLYGSSESIPSLVRKADTGEILAWPYWRQTLSTSPQNTHSVIRPLKAALDEIEAAGGTPSPTFWSDIEDALRSLGTSLRPPSHAGADGAKAGREQAAIREFRAAFGRFEAATRTGDTTP